MTSRNKKGFFGYDLRGIRVLYQNDGARLVPVYGHNLVHSMDWIRRPLPLRWWGNVELAIFDLSTSAMTRPRSFASDAAACGCCATPPQGHPP